MPSEEGCPGYDEPASYEPDFFVGNIFFAGLASVGKGQKERERKKEREKREGEGGNHECERNTIKSNGEPNREMNPEEQRKIIRRHRDLKEYGESRRRGKVEKSKARRRGAEWGMKRRWGRCRHKLSLRPSLQNAPGKTKSPGYTAKRKRWDTSLCWQGRHCVAQAGEYTMVMPARRKKIFVLLRDKSEKIFSSLGKHKHSARPAAERPAREHRATGNEME